ncbi:Mitochondrial import inner membrane translocase subunit TIM10 [Saitozyma sp. JCM 24511]|uniref:Mitochondrial import inner membrane translocase subunit n=1 Tax=Saitozyma podzolica TaxID=1890683 RepID=A0A427YIU5_9TREE|nr:protein transporter tim10 [Saitozyma podzolica]GFZ45075.1 Mitochondrial import inner membrane translocase subunit TIM10 [Saitozyma sp. JCM 24511]
MSFLFGGGARQDPGAVDPMKIEMAVAELDMITDVFNRLVNSCHAKCIQPNPMSHRYAEGDLLKGEAVCIDRCSAKFFEVNKVVGEKMQAMGQGAQATGSFGR